MTKKIAVLIRTRQQKALRTALGLTLADDKVTIFIMDNKLEKDEMIDLSIEALCEMNVIIYSNNHEDKFQHMSTEEIARALVEYDVVIPY
ncbi:MAG: hypothetical protein HY755_00785 [Nitrospirae bacterium]|nr:hypothetical protein [Nitrospirota bacterium]